MIRTDAEMPVSRFCMLIGIPRRTYNRKLALVRTGHAVQQLTCHLPALRKGRRPAAGAARSSRIAEGPACRRAG